MKTVFLLFLAYANGQKNKKISKIKIMKNKIQIQKTKPNKYFHIVGEIDGETQKLFGSFDRSDCTYEKECEGESWKTEGFKKIRIVTVETVEEADAEIYGEELKTSSEVFRAFAPAFDFELNEQELIADGLENGWLSKAGTDKFIGNPFTHLGA